MAARPAKNSKKSTKAEGRAKSLLTEIGDEAKRKAMRDALLRALKENGWNLTATAEALRMGHVQSVIRALNDLAPDEYDAAKTRGDISPANRRDA